MTHFVIDRDRDKIVAGPYAERFMADGMRDSMALHPSAGTLEVAEAAEVPLFDVEPANQEVAWWR